MFFFLWVVLVLFGSVVSFLGVLAGEGIVGGSKFWRYV